MDNKALFIESMDPDGAYLWISLHHIVQMLLFIPLVWIAKKTAPAINLGLSFGEIQKGIGYVGKFLLFFTIYSIVSFGLALLMQNFQPFQYPMNARNVFGYLGFQLFLSGPSEEFLFRSFGLGIVGFFVGKRVFKSNVSIANIIIALFFAFAPFALRYDEFQLIYAFILGLIYGDCYENPRVFFIQWCFIVSLMSLL